VRREPSLVKLYGTIRSEIARHRGGVTGEELQLRLPDLSKHALRIGLLDLCCSGAVERDARGRYSVLRA